MNNLIRNVVLAASAVILVFAGVGCGGGVNGLEMESGRGAVDTAQCAATPEELIELEAELSALRDRIAQSAGECADTSPDTPDIFVLSDPEMCLLNLYDSDLEVSLLGRATSAIEALRGLINPESTEVFDILSTLTSGSEEIAVFLDFERVVELDANDPNIQHTSTVVRNDTSVLVMKVRADAHDQMVAYLNDLINRPDSKADAIWVGNDIVVIAHADHINDAVGIVSARLANGDDQKKCPIYGVDTDMPRPAVYAMLDAGAQFVLDGLNEPKMLEVKKILTDDTYLAIGGLDVQDDVWRIQLAAFDPAAMKAAGYMLLKFDTREKLVDALLNSARQE